MYTENKSSGKFEACRSQYVASVLYSILNDGRASECVGDVDETGCYSLIEGKHFDFIMEEDRCGFFSYQVFDKADTQQAWARILQKVEKLDDCQIADDDIKLDHIPDRAECRSMLRQFEKEGFWPNVWYINERGNVDFLTITRHGAKIGKSWV